LARFQLECDLEEKSLSEQSLSSELSKKCEIISSLEKNIIDCDQLKKQHIQEMQKLSSQYEQNIKEVTETLTTNHLEEKKQLLSQHESECMKMSKQFETETENLHSQLIQKREELDEFLQKTSIATEDIKKSYKLETEQALNDQEKLFQEKIEQVISRPKHKLTTPNIFRLFI